MKKNICCASFYLHCWKCEGKEKFDLEFLVWSECLEYCEKAKFRVNKIFDLEESRDKLKLESAMW